MLSACAEGGALSWRHLVAWIGLSQSWGSGCDGRCQVLVVGGLETLAEAGAERAVVDRTADLEQTVGTAPGPAHLLRLVHPAVHQEVGCALGQRHADPQPGSMPLGIVDQPIALAGEIIVQYLQGGPQLARGRDGPAAAGLVPEVMHDRADPVDADPGVLGLTVPQPPAQALGLLDDHRLRRRALRVVG